MLSEDLRIELEDICQENDLTIDFNFNHPIRVTVSKSMQVGFYEGVPEEAYLRFKFGVDEVDIEFVGEFRLDDKLFSKLANKIKKLHYIYLSGMHRKPIDLRMVLRRCGQPVMEIRLH